jgi:hypothetical protein
MIARMQPANVATRRHIRHRIVPVVVGAAVALLTLVGPLAVASRPAGAVQASGAVAAQAQCGTDLAANPAAPRLAVGASTLPAAGAATVTVTGSRYLTGRYVCGVSKFGGIYVFFGWVQPGGQWGPSWRSATSSAGQFGTTYTYSGEGGGGETRDDGSGTLRLVSFTAGGTSGDETPFHMDANGNWSTTLTVAGPVFSWKDLVTGASQTVDCRAVQCGIFTMGAHGIASRSNEQFVPLSFASGPGGTVPPGATSPSNGSSGVVGTAPVQVEAWQSDAVAPAGSAGTAGAGGAVATTTVAPDGPATSAPGAAGADASTTIDRDALRGASAAPTGDDASDESAMVRVADAEDGGSPLAVLAAVALVGLLVAGAVVLVRRRRRPPVDVVATG